MADETPLSLHTLKPAEGSTKERKRVGRGHGSGNGKTSGRGQKGQKSRSGSHNMRPGFEGGQMPIYMRLGKSRGSNKKMSMPMGPFRTYTSPVNVRDLERFDAGVEVTPELLDQAGLVRNLRHPVKVLGDGTLTKKLTVHAHRFSARAVEAIEGAGGTVVVIGGKVEEEPAKPKRKPAKPKAEAAAEQAPAADEPAAEAEPVAEEPVADEEPAAEEPAEEAAPQEEPEAAADEPDAEAPADESTEG
jgi:large subunit ribosomal protein L15